MLSHYDDYKDTVVGVDGLEGKRQNLQWTMPYHAGTVRALTEAKIWTDAAQKHNEALLRRVRKGDAIPRINSLVDIVNWCSLEFQLPYGLYDLSKINGAVTIRLGVDGESYPGIRKDDVNVSGRITVADATGAFGNPTSDSARTMVTTATTDALVVIYAPAEIASTQVRRVLEVTSARIADIAGGREIARNTA